MSLSCEKRFGVYRKIKLVAENFYINGERIEATLDTTALPKGSTRDFLFLFDNFHEMLYEEFCSYKKDLPVPPSVHELIKPPRKEKYEILSSMHIGNNVQIQSLDSFLGDTFIIGTICPQENNDRDFINKAVNNVCTLSFDDKTQTFTQNVLLESTAKEIYSGVRELPNGNMIVGKRAGFSIFKPDDNGIYREDFSFSLEGQYADFNAVYDIYCKDNNEFYIVFTSSIQKCTFTEKEGYVVEELISDKKAEGPFGSTSTMTNLFYSSAGYFYRAYGSGMIQQYKDTLQNSVGVITGGQEKMITNIQELTLEQLVITYYDGGLRFLVHDNNARSGRPSKKFVEDGVHTAFPYDYKVIFSHVLPDDSIVTCDENGILKRTYADGSSLYRAENQKVLYEHDCKIICFQFLPDGKIVAGDKKGNVFMLDGSIPAQ